MLTNQGFRLFPFGILAIRSPFFPKILGIMLIVASFATLAHSFLHIVLPAYKHVVSRVTMPIDALGELSMVHLR